jgi:hypothetical protein
MMPSMDGWWDGCMDDRTDGWMMGRMDGWRDGWMESFISSTTSFNICNLPGWHPTLRIPSLFTLPHYPNPLSTALHYYPTSTLIWSHSYTTHPWELAVTLQGRGSYSPTLTKSISNGVQYVILHSTIGRRKVKMCRFGSGKWFWLNIIEHFEVAGKRRNNTVHLLYSFLYERVKVE